jgi:hypothetical protein
VSEEKLPLEEALVEASVVRNELPVPDEGEKAAENGGDRRRAAELLLSEAGETRYGFRKRDSGVHERLKGVDGLERPDANGPELADAAVGSGEARGLEVEDDELGLLEQRVVPSGQGDDGAGADDSAVAGSDVGQEGTGQSVGDGGDGKERTRRLDCRQ